MSGRLTSTERSHERLAERRRKSRSRGTLVFAVLFLILFGVLVYGFWQKPVRITHITIYGADQTFAATAFTAMSGSYFGLMPRDSAFLYSGTRVRAAILAQDPTIAAVSIFRDGLTGLSIKIDYRVPIARWCGSVPALALSTSTAPGASSDCYVFDANGLLYASSSDSQPVNGFSVYESLPDSNFVLGVTLPNASRFPVVFNFARQLANFGSPAASIIFRSDEADVYLKSGTRITYVLGEEREAFAVLTSARTNLNLADGSLDYVDLRFPGKVYLKKK